MAQPANFVNFPYFPPTSPHYFPTPPNVQPPHVHPPSPPTPTVVPPHPPPPPPKFPIFPPPPPDHVPTPLPNHPISLPMPPPPGHPITPPVPPHSVPPPPPPPHVVPSPPPAPGHHHPTVIIFVFVSIGGVFFLAFLAAALFCWVQKRKKKIVQETDKITVDEHVRIREDIEPGPDGTQRVVLTIDDDVHIEEEIDKKLVEIKRSHVGSPHIGCDESLEMGASTSEPNHQLRRDMIKLKG